MYACINKEQQVPEYQQSVEPQWNTQSNKNVSIQHENITKVINKKLKCHQIRNGMFVNQYHFVTFLL